ncbi:hypothetical protein DPEC_G00077330 [Dallia pectoralis]|uniref:Uncharacterized protein n=1 Tax=Dallia pectoralis TaxID=75939 RepID=A0ACC2H409_DALPE|nr:hypothetical protein DPEC_G00077330 [Dallia pectoralis]
MDAYCAILSNPPEFQKPVNFIVTNRSDLQATSVLLAYDTPPFRNPLNSKKFWMSSERILIQKAGVCASQTVTTNPNAPGTEGTEVETQTRLLGAPNRNAAGEWRKFDTMPILFQVRGRNAGKECAECNRATKRANRGAQRCRGVAGTQQPDFIHSHYIHQASRRTGLHPHHIPCLELGSVESLSCSAVSRPGMTLDHGVHKPPPQQEED